MKDSATRLKLCIDWSDLDVFGHVNHLAILKYVQAARVNYLDAIGLMESQSGMKIGPILASLSCQFRKPLYFPGQVTVDSKADEIKNTSFRIRHGVYNDKMEVAAEAQDIIVLFDFHGQTKLTIPQDLRKKIEHFQYRHAD
jgi:acyl-CoA thioester hydrolase